MRVKNTAVFKDPFGDSRRGLKASRLPGAFFSGTRIFAENPDDFPLSIRSQTGVVYPSESVAGRRREGRAFSDSANCPFRDSLFTAFVLFSQNLGEEEGRGGSWKGGGEGDYLRIVPIRPSIRRMLMEGPPKNLPFTRAGTVLGQVFGGGNRFLKIVGFMYRRSLTLASCFFICRIMGCGRFSVNKQE